MSKKEQKIYDVMSAIRKLTKPSKGIDTFERLLNEVSPEALNVFVSDMNKFIEKFSIISRNVDVIDDASMRANILTYKFINPASCFTSSYSYTKKMAKKLSILNYIQPNSKKCYTFNMSRKSILGTIQLDSNGIEYKEGITLPNEYEELRLIFLTWNYLPAMVKAIIMTKRREFGFDTNSKKF